MDLLLAKGEQEAEQYAKQLTSLNEERKQVSEEAFVGALEQAEKQVAKGDKVLVCQGEFHFGVIGIAASKLVERYGRPAILFSRESIAGGKAVFKGSGRSVEGVDLYQVLQSCQHLIIRFGGHRMAAGLVVAEENYHKFVAAINETVATIWPTGRIVRSGAVDLEMSLGDLFADQKALGDLCQLEPHGPGNPQAIFFDKQARLERICAVGKGKNHLSVVFSCPTVRVKGIGFGLGASAASLRPDHSCGVIYTPMVNKFRKPHQWEARILDIFPLTD
jgi:single-stranded-DNA-specific exonuclease